MSRPMHVYVATDGDLFKIGISANPAKRMLEHGKTVRLLAHWRRPYAREIESTIKGIFSHCRAPRGNEWFRTTEKEIMFEVIRTLRIVDNDEAIKAGRTPVPREIRQKTMPPLELDWLS